MRQLRIEYNSSYGVNRLSGWSISVDGSVVVQFERRLITAVFKTLWKLWEWRQGIGDGNA